MVPLHDCRTEACAMGCPLNKRVCKPRCGLKQTRKHATSVTTSYVEAYAKVEKANGCASEVNRIPCRRHEPPRACVCDFVPPHNSVLSSVSRVEAAPVCRFEIQTKPTHKRSLPTMQKFATSPSTHHVTRPSQDTPRQTPGMDTPALLQLEDCRNFHNKA